MLPGQQPGGSAPLLPVIISCLHELKLVLVNVRDVSAFTSRGSGEGRTSVDPLEPRRKLLGRSLSARRPPPALCSSGPSSPNWESNGYICTTGWRNRAAAADKAGPVFLLKRRGWQITQWLLLINPLVFTLMRPIKKVNDGYCVLPVCIPKRVICDLVTS